jgi:hypothetical protein
LSYFLALGLGYLFVEMVLIQRLVFFLANPVYAVAVVLSGLLLLSGLGSAWASMPKSAILLGGRRQARQGPGVVIALFAALGVAAIALLYAFSLHAVLRPLIGLPLPARVAVAFVAIFPLAAMGIPFPIGLRHISSARPELLPWAWAINGCASVVATALATLLAMSAGLPAVLLAASGCYLSAALIAQKWNT